MSVFFGTGCMLMMLPIGKVLFAERWERLLAILLLAVTPWAVKYFSSATPYALVSFISLLLFYVLMRRNEMPAAVFVFVTGALYFVLFFIRNNMVFGIVLFLVYILLASGAEKPWTSAIFPVLLFTMFAAILLALFPPKLAYYVVRLPYIKTLIHKLPVFSTYALVELNTFKTSGSTAVFWRIDGSLSAFMGHYLREYSFTVLLSLAGIVFSVRGVRRRSPAAFTAVYFIAMSALHFIGSQVYCRTCIRPYTNYFYVFGCLGAAYGVSSLVRLHPFPRCRIRMFIAELVTFCLFLFFLVLNLSHLQMMISRPHDSYIKRILDLSTQIAEVIPEEKKTLIIGGIPETTQALFYAGRSFEITAIFQDHFHRTLKSGLSVEEREKTLQGLREMSWWSDEMMESWIRDGYEYILTDGGKTFRRFEPLVSRYFKPVQEVRQGRKKVYTIFARVPGLADDG